MLNLQPLEKFAIAYQLDDPSDTATYYIQAVIRNAITDVVIDTVNLTDKTDQRFRGSWVVCSDPVGLGLYITITIKVYTDSGYTTLASKYGIQEDQYLVQDRMTLFGGKGGGSVDVDYKRIQKMITAATTGLQPAKPVDIQPILQSLKNLKTAIADIPKYDDTRIASKIDAMASFGMMLKEIKQLIQAIDMPKPAQIDLLASRMTNFDANAIQSTMDEMWSRIKRFFIDDVDTINAKIDELLTQQKNTQLVILKPENE